MATSVFDEIVNADGSTGVWYRIATTPVTRSSDVTNIIDIRTTSVTEAIPTEITAGQAPTFPALMRIRADNGNVVLRLSLSTTLFNSFPDFTTEVEGNLVVAIRTGDRDVAFNLNNDADNPYGNMAVVAFIGDADWDGTQDDAIDRFVAYNIGRTDDAVFALVDGSNSLFTAETLMFGDPTPVAPVFSDDTGDAQTWTQNVAIAPITVPAASGSPAPEYAAVGILPAGMAFDVSTRVLSGAPTIIGSGTITIRATNSAGMDDWTIDYSTVAPLTTPVFADNFGDAQSWIANVAIASITVPAASGNPEPAYAVEGSLPAGIAFNVLTRVLSGTPTAVGSGTITIRATNSQGNDDWTVAYVTSAAPVAPAFTDNTGDAQTWTQNTAIVPIVVPLASGIPTPTYAVVGSLPDGIVFDTGTRAISGAPTAIDSGTITIRATNSEGMVDWTIDYATSAALVAPSFVDNSGDAQTWIENTPIVPIIVPLATGNPTPMYAAVGSLPAGIVFNDSTRIISGAPTGIGSGTITIRATNSEGATDWTVDYATSAALAPPLFVDSTGSLKTWIENSPIVPIIVPLATGNPVPMYTVVGSLPDGIDFDTGMHVLSGAPTAVGVGTIAIRATNSQGIADWTFEYSTIAAPTDFVELGDNGDWASGQVNEIPYVTYIGVRGRLLTRRGRQIMRPLYGLNVQQEVNRNDVEKIRLATVQALAGLEGARGLRVGIDRATREITIVVARDV